jgi:hypothetical protein
MAIIITKTKSVTLTDSVITLMRSSMVGIIYSISKYLSYKRINEFLKNNIREVKSLLQSL